MQKILRRYRIDCIIDAGANVGRYAGFLRRQVVHRGLIVSFEPDPVNIEALAKASRGDDLRDVQDYPLGEMSGMYAVSESRFPHAPEFDCIYLPAIENGNA